MNLFKLKKILKYWPPIKYYFNFRYSIGSIPYYLMRVFPIQKNKIVMSSFHGKYSGDPKYISEALVRESTSIDIVWLLKDPHNCEEASIKKIKYPSLRAIYELSTARIWVDDCRKDGCVRKRKNQFYIGTGHGGIPMKRIEKDVVDKLPIRYLTLAKNDSDMTDLKPSNSQWRNNMLRRAFWYNGEIYNCGLPRVERLIKEKNVVKEYVKKIYKLNSEVHLFLYAPTFRESGDTTIYNLDFHKVKIELAEKFGGEWIGLRRLHPNVKKYNRIDIPGVVIDTTEYPDMEDLLMASDALITDYSSCVFETLFLNIPAFVFATDIEKYMEEERSLYWDIKELPFPIATQNDELGQIIKRFDKSLYDKKIGIFKKQLGLFDDQIHATELIVKRIMKVFFET